jgi:hypothetical protein
MKKYIIKQPNHYQINDEKAFKIGRADINTCFRANIDGDYKVTGFITAEDLNEVFRIGNTEPDQIEKVGKFYSISCGDIIVDPDNQRCHLVSPMGFTGLGYDPHFGKEA